MLLHLLNEVSHLERGKITSLGGQVVCGETSSGSEMTRYLWECE